MKTYQTRSPQVLKYYYLFLFFYLPWYSVSRLIYAINTIKHFDMSGPFEYIGLFIPPAIYLSMFLLGRFKKAGLFTLAIFHLLHIASNVGGVLAINVNDTYSIINGISGILEAVLLAVISYVYFRKRISFFNGKAEICEDQPAKRMNIVVASIVCILLTFTFFELISAMASTIANALYDVFPFMTKLLSYPYPGDVPLEYPFSLAIGIIEVLISFTLVLVLLKAKIINVAASGMERSNKPILSTIAGAVSGVLITGLITVCLVLRGAVVQANPLFPRVVFTIIIAIPFYLTVGIYEEISFRGIMLGYFNSRKAKFVGVLLSALLFSAIHYINGAYDELRYLFFIFAFGIFAGVVLLVTNNLWLCIGLHWGYDFAVCSLFEIRFMVTQNSFFRVTKSTRTENCMTIAAVYLLLTVIILVISLIKKKKQKAQ